jgi:hypothetical protein
LRPPVIASSAIRITTSTKKLASNNTSGGLSFEESIAEQAYSAQLVSRLKPAPEQADQIPIVFVHVSDPVGQGCDEPRLRDLNRLTTLIQSGQNCLHRI